MPKIQRRRNVQSTERNSQRIYPFGKGIGTAKSFPNKTIELTDFETGRTETANLRELQKAYEKHRKQNPLSEQDWHHARHEIAFHRLKKRIPLPDEKQQTKGTLKEISRETIGERIKGTQLGMRQPIKIPKSTTFNYLKFGESSICTISQDEKTIRVSLLNEKADGEFDFSKERLLQTNSLGDSLIKSKVSEKFGLHFGIELEAVKEAWNLALK